MKMLVIVVLTFYLGLCYSQDRIIGGQPAEEGDFPFQVSLRRSHNLRHFCGGTIIDSRHILTAAHCMYYSWGGRLPPYVVLVVAGHVNLTSSDMLYHEVSKITVHPGFIMSTMANDVAILELKEALQTQNDPLINTIALHSKPILTGKCIVSGWGVQTNVSNVISQRLNYAEVYVVPLDKCQTMYGPNITLVEEMMCAGHELGETDSCQGDSGGPLICDGLQAGVISTGFGCAQADYPGIYASVPKLLQWIKTFSVIESTEDNTTINYTTENISQTPAIEVTTSNNNLSDISTMSSVVTDFETTTDSTDQEKEFTAEFVTDVVTTTKNGADSRFRTYFIKKMLLFLCYLTISNHLN